MEKCTECKWPSMRNTQLTEIVNVNVDEDHFDSIKVDINVSRCNLCGHYEFTKKIQEPKKPKKTKVSREIKEEL